MPTQLNFRARASAAKKFVTPMKLLMEKLAQMEGLDYVPAVRELVKIFRVISPNQKFDGEPYLQIKQALNEILKNHDENNVPIPHEVSVCLKQALRTLNHLHFANPMFLNATVPAVFMNDDLPFEEKEFLCVLDNQSQKTRTSIESFVTRMLEKVDDFTDNTLSDMSVMTYLMQQNENCLGPDRNSQTLTGTNVKHRYELLDEIFNASVQSMNIAYDSVLIGSNAIDVYAVAIDCKENPEFMEKCKQLQDKNFFEADVAKRKKKFWPFIYKDDLVKFLIIGKEWIPGKAYIVALELFCVPEHFSTGYGSGQHHLNYLNIAAMQAQSFLPYLPLNYTVKGIMSTVPGIVRRNSSTQNHDENNITFNLNWGNKRKDQPQLRDLLSVYQLLFTSMELAIKHIDGTNAVDISSLKAVQRVETFVGKGSKKRDTMNSMMNEFTDKIGFMMQDQTEKLRSESEKLRSDFEVKVNKVVESELENMRKKGRIMGQNDLSDFLNNKKALPDGQYFSDLIAHACRQHIEIEPAQGCGTPGGQYAQFNVQEAMDNIKNNSVELDD